MRKSSIKRTKIVSAGSLAANLQSPATEISFLDNVFYQCNITGATAAGTLKVQTSNDYQEIEPTRDIVNPGTWVDLPGMSATIAGPDTVDFDINQIGSCAIRIAFVQTSGTGSIDIYVSGKMV